MKNVTVYTTTTWPWCHKVKAYLKSKGIDYTEKDVASDQDAAMEMIQKSGQRGVPVVDIDGNIIVGFDKEEIDKLI